MINPFFPTVPKFALRETDVSRHNWGTSGAPLEPRRDDSALSGGQKWVNTCEIGGARGLLAFPSHFFFLLNVWKFVPGFWLHVLFIIEFVRIFFS